MILLAAFAALAVIGLVSTLVSLATDARRRIPTDNARIPARDRVVAETRQRVRDRGARSRVSVTRPGLEGTR